MVDHSSYYYVRYRPGEKLPWTVLAGYSTKILERYATLAEAQTAVDRKNGKKRGR